MLLSWKLTLGDQVVGMSSLPGSRGTTPTVGDMAGVGGARSLGRQRCLVTNGPGPWHTVLLDACHRGYRFRSDGGGGASFSDTSALLPPHAPRGRGVGAVPRPRHCRVSWGLGSHQTAPATPSPPFPLRPPHASRCTPLQMLPSAGLSRVLRLRNRCWVIDAQLVHLRGDTKGPSHSSRMLTAPGSIN